MMLRLYLYFKSIMKLSIHVVKPRTPSMSGRGNDLFIYRAIVTIILAYHSLPLIPPPGAIIITSHGARLVTRSATSDEKISNSDDFL